MKVITKINDETWHSSYRLMVASHSPDGNFKLMIACRHSNDTITLSLTPEEQTKLLQRLQQPGPPSRA